MFGRNATPIANCNTPPWALALARKYRTSKGVPDIRWIVPTALAERRASYGCAYIEANIVIIYARDGSLEETKEHKMVLLHELAHLLKGSAPIKTSERRRKSHTEGFWQNCLDIYEVEGILPYAASREPYAKGRKLALKRLSRKATAMVDYEEITELGKAIPQMLAKKEDERKESLERAMAALEEQKARLQQELASLSPG